MASTHSPTLTSSESPIGTALMLSASICKIAKSVPRSKPTTVASKTLLSLILP